MKSPAEIVDRLSQEPSGDRSAVLAVLGDSEVLRSWQTAREGKWLRYLESLTADPSSPAKDTAGEVEREQKVGAGRRNAARSGPSSWPTCRRRSPRSKRAR